RHLGVAEIPAEITEQLLLVPMHERLESRLVPAPAAAPQEFLVGNRAVRPTPWGVARFGTAGT
ncbi:MAG: hypothetical protein KGR24_09755, partial [Planctomycetes bacterium]|nr:hypothetical protein [Planctomycetota bacterium]